MIPEVESRLALVGVFLTLQVAVFVLELLIFTSSISEHRGYIPLRQWIAPAGLALLGTVLVPVTFASPNTDVQATGSQCAAGIDADVAGMGVRSAVWVQVGVLIMVTFMGSFHLKATGAKEIGAGLVLTHVSLAVALVVQLRRGTLSLADAAAGAMILDAQNMALSIQLAAKQALAARWQVGIVVVVQVFGLAVVPVLASNLFAGSFATDSCRCLTVFWWAWLSNCLTSSREQAVFWIYYTSRCVGFSQAAFHAIYNTQTFHEAEPKCGSDGDEEQKKGGLLVGITYPYIAEGKSAPGVQASYNVARYGEYPATVSFMYGWYGVYALTSLAVAEMAMRDVGLQPTSAIDSIGQIIALVVAAATTLRAAWLFGKLFTDEWSSTKKFGFMWPFHLPQRAFRRPATYLLTKSFDIPPSAVKLGSIIKSPDDPTHPISDEPLPIPPGMLITTTSAGTAQFPFNPPSQASFFTRLLSVFLGGLLEHRISFRHTTMRRLETTHLLTDKNYLAASMRQPKVVEYIEHLGKMGPRMVYMVTGVMVAKGLTVTSGDRREQSFNLGLPVAGVGRQRSAEHMQTSSVEGDVVVAYQLQAIILGKNFRVRGSTRYTKGALL